MTAAVIIVLILVGLPLLAWWVGGRRFWNRLKPGRGPDPWGDFVRSHRLSPSEATAVQSAVTKGAALDDEKLRRAAVDLAEETLGQLGSWPQNGTTAQRVLAAVFLLWSLVFVAGLVFAVAFGGLSDVPWFALAPAVVTGGTQIWARRRMRQAIELNSGPVGE
ncbi:hypothetical protein [Modestobacter italicus]|uniref:hypothetical protein n=1 Tax=Modestobacter italicus (strain DSM 44449 / CECT 9708 / BC 501) TaxID=2732864 RepID=UPI001C93DB4A|nr:hypothetical protein [Modestobacter italicus]